MARIDELVARLQSAARNKSLDIGAAWNLLDEAADVLERVFNGLDYEASCPCCQKKDECEEDCTFKDDAPSSYERMQYIRELLNIK